MIDTQNIYDDQQLTKALELSLDQEPKNKDVDGTFIDKLWDLTYKRIAPLVLFLISKYNLEILYVL